MNHETDNKPASDDVVLNNKFPVLSGYSREQLEEEVHLLRISLAEMKANTGVRTEFGYLKAAPFFERAHEEFSRSRRYGSPLTLVVVTMIGHEKIKQSLGQDACDYYVEQLAEKCKNSCREGADILGVISDDRFGIILPEANISGCTRFKERLKDELAASTIKWNNQPVKSGMKISAGVLLGHDRSFNELFERTTLQKATLDEKAA